MPGTTAGQADVVTPLPSATVIVIRDGTRGIEALLLKRNPELRHMPGMWVFPGGKIDGEDQGHSPEAQARVAAAREAEEEAGLKLAPEELVDFSHWLTPLVMKRRFATWFYLAAVESNTAVRVDGGEIVDFQWISPERALAEQRKGELSISPPTFISLHDLAAWSTVVEAMAAVADRVPPYFFPNVVRHEGEPVYLYPGDSGYDAGDAAQKAVLHRANMVAGGIHYCRDFDWPARAAP